MPADKASTGTSIEVLAAAVALSRQMLESAKAGEWDRLAALESERSLRLGSDISSSLALSPAAAAEAKSLLATCLRLNDEITALTGAHMVRLGEVLAEMSRASADHAPPQRPTG